MQKLYNQFKNKGLELVAINSGDSPATINKYVKDNNWSFKIVMGQMPGGKGPDIFARYGVQAFPTNYLLDSRGRVVWRAVGFDDAGLRKALAQMGLK